MLYPQPGWSHCTLVEGLKKELMKVSPGYLVPSWLPQNFEMVGTCFDHGQRLEVKVGISFLPKLHHHLLANIRAPMLPLCCSPGVKARLCWKQSHRSPHCTSVPRRWGMIRITRSGCGRSDTRGQGWHTVGAFPGGGGTSLGLYWGAGADCSLGCMGMLRQGVHLQLPVLASVTTRERYGIKP